MQIYLLSVLSTIAAGAILAADYLADRVPALEPLRRFAASSRAKSALGATAAVVGLVALVWRFPPRRITVPGQEPEILFIGQRIILGDLLPAVAGMLLGAILIADRYREGRLSGDDVEQVAAGDEAADGDATPESPVSVATRIAQIGNAIRPYRAPLGVAGIAIGLIHFLLASLPLL